MAAGAYLRAKKAGMAFDSKAARRSAGPVFVMEGEPRRPVEEVQTSRRPQVLRTSSMRARVASSDVGW